MVITGFIVKLEKPAIRKEIMKMIGKCRSPWNLIGKHNKPVLKNFKVL